MLVALAWMAACDVPSTTIEPFAGTWAGGTTEFQVALTLSQTRDTVRGGLRLTRRSDSYLIESPALAIPLDGDFFTFSFSPAPASGYSLVTFRAERRGDRIDAAFGLDGNETAVVLERL
jgi:hypothetical protein